MGHLQVAGYFDIACYIFRREKDTGAFLEIYIPLPDPSVKLTLLELS